MKAAEDAALKLYDENSAKEPEFKAIFDEWKKFRERIYAWNKVNEWSFANHVYNR